MDALADRLKVIEEVGADPPVVHLSADGDAAPGGVWRTGDDCYRVLAEACPPGTRTLETGVGISTVLFARWQARHTAVVPWQGEVDRCRSYFASRGIADEVTFVVGRSDEVLPALPREEIDVFLIDGSHGFPAPVIDWYYGASRLRRGGLLVVDDVQLATVSRSLVWYLDLDPRWTRVAGTGKWSAWRRESEGPLDEDWTQQTFVGSPHRGWRGRVTGAARQVARRVARRSR